ncbi:MAG: hypothetical protein NT169_24220 [Chloroflexi bacterium]|nr:hypothetical protein [Chloroflexota bacterium]
MSSKMLWAISLPAAIIGWMVLLLTTGAVPPSSAVAWAIAAVLLTLAVTMTAAPLVWVIAHRLRLPGAGTSPAVALRIAAWIGLWAAMVVSLRLARAFDWVVVLTLAAVLGLAETFLQQVERTNGRRRTNDG